MASITLSPVDDGSNGQSESTSRQPRRSTADVNEAVFEAVREELAEVGYQRLTMVGVARRAGTSRKALYLRWTSKDQMVHDAVVPHVPTAAAFVSSGDLRTDLVAFVQRLTAFEGPLGRAIRSLLAESYRDPDSMADLRDRLLVTSGSGLRQLLLEAIARGEADPEALDPEVSMIIGAIAFHQLCISAEPMHEDAVGRLVDRFLLPMVQSESYAEERAAKSV